MNFIKNKLVIIGAGMVGSAVLNSVMALNLLSEIVIVDQNEQKARGEAMDASHTTSFTYSPNVRIHAGEYADCRDAQIVVVTAGPSIKPGEAEDRLVLTKKNVKVMREVMKSISSYTKEAIIIVVTNPLDVATYVAQNEFDYPRSLIIGTGTLLDTARFRHIIAMRYGVDTKNVHGYILGEHGKTAFAAWSLVSIAGISLPRADEIFSVTEPLDQEQVIKEVREAGWEIINLKGYTNTGVAMSVSRLVKAILLNEQSIVPVSTTLSGEYGISGVALSIPCVVSNQGISRKLEFPLADSEVEEMERSADTVRAFIQ